MWCLWLLLVTAAAVREDLTDSKRDLEMDEFFRNPCASSKCAGEHKWAGMTLTYSKCDFVKENGKPEGRYQIDGKDVKPRQINSLGFDDDLPTGAGYVCRERCDIYNPKKDKTATQTLVYRTGKADDPWRDADWDEMRS
eukprot:Skav201572  [mRNA]  locus=scaffold152:105837:108153:+ [translate_table: standard]